MIAIHTQHFQLKYSSAVLQEMPCICKSKSICAFLKICTSLSTCSQTGLRCIFMFPITTHGETESKQRNSLSENASSCVCRDETVIPTLNLASAYWLLQSIDNSSRKGRGCERERKSLASLTLLLSLSLTYPPTHTGTLNMLSLVWPVAISLIYP